ncbi:tryptophan halogenase family protein [Shewanella sp. CG12_big_fil_rev_8_21_14_0_65_47_15]|uniref:tryptophan halogenase family protein n=1 Tax=Shewanella sp. CG12_big_fil_rev_8_21_14_0_65_47_15 TaxID=1975537 RepID=UPI000CC3BD5F|nr:tryptophan halogenase family protein [Shewanella sp. CG12_big_fil_rev_8_21_14_0_65_47_15]PIW60994.1 MAG: tryptophan 7-halogenase [Shewanella sp. CG12_big_fil_rev_8_21_14_0_65_47_15]
MTIRKIAIIGGGTSGWLAANHLGRVLKDNPELSITLIESPDIPIIGVGEGTVPAIRRSLQSFGISESEFIRSCDVTFKQSIKFVNWLDKSRHGKGNFYHHLFDMPSSLGEDLTPSWLMDKSEHFAEYVSPQHAVCEANKAPKLITTPEYSGVLGYAYHLNAAKFAKLLAKNAVEKFKVEHISTTVRDVNLTADSAIASLLTDNGVLSFDFYIDCSGFESILLAKKLEVPFINKSHQLFIDTALVAQVPTQQSDIIPPFTLATAHQAGWIWDIALTQRRGTGFVYSSQHMEHAEAEAKFDRYLGGKLADVVHRKIPMTVGYRQQFWAKNCVALGLAQGFLEPIEATSILLTDFSARLLAERFPTDKEDISYLAKRFNDTVSQAWERVVEFAKLHYCLSDRADSAFWRDNRADETIPDLLKQRLTLWKQFSPISEDFPSKFEVFNMDNYLYVLYGMKYPTKQPHTNPASLKNAKLHLNELRNITLRMVDGLPEHRELLEKISLYGLQRI